ncbi:glycosyltransferase family 87 protein [Paeniglutamicibacter cryotolerans]|uniref:Putative membrane protein n=1 Tax=Paeniglutamicibacter cryotolerans TaxID=670079 RepID=A0A839QF53_9MICC|nr:glycosyltransferase 87 family protein [Paeniglutamicibacter cryotolerans]MBB2994898.1 putative membrane protein [Paeniglutamicibacter cryotolerans]
MPENTAVPEPRRGPVRITVPTRNDPLLRQLTEVVGGPLGRHTDPGRVTPGFWRIERVLILLTGIAAILAVLSKNMCRLYGWGGENSYQWACYSDWAALFHARGFADNAFAPFAAGAQFEYPVLMSVVASLTAALVPAGNYDRTLAFYDLNVFFAVLLWFVVVIATARSAGRRPWDAAMVALAPGIILASTINWDMWAVMFLALAMLAWSRNMPFVAGVLVGLGTAMKLYPVLFFGAVIVLAIRSGRLRPLWLSLAGAAVAWVGVNLPAAIANFDSWSYFLTFTGDRGAGLSSIWHAWNLTAAVVPGMPSLDASMINVLAFTLFFLSCVGVLVLGLVAPRRPRFAPLLFLIVGAFILFNKVYSPQFVIWLVPLAALAWPRWRDFLVWQLIEVLHFWAIWMYLYAETADIQASNTFPPSFYVFAVLGHMIATGYLMYRVAHSIMNPDFDPVRRVGQDDPQAGPFAGAADRFTWPLKRRSVGADG